MMLTIFTPTFNRGSKLVILYNSLQNQTNYDFEWIVVDDGSTDNTELLVKEWIKENKNFSIRYIKQTNRGKHAAINVGVENSYYDWFFIVDSDDYITCDAVEIIYKWIDTGLNESFAGVSGLRITEKGKILGGKPKIEGDYVDCKNNERKKYHLEGDKAEVYKTSILKKYPFPIFEGETFLSEVAVWDKIASDGYFIRWFNYPITICEYLDDGLSAKVKYGNLEIKNFKGYTYSTKIRIEANSGLDVIRIVCQYLYQARKRNYRLEDIRGELNVNMHFLIFCWVLAIIKGWKAIIKKLVHKICEIKYLLLMI